MTRPSVPELLSLIEHELLAALDNRKKQGFSSPRLNEALKYALTSPGKRLRPLMVLVAALSCGTRLVHVRHALAAACAVEYVHTYSLIHDDLPCMDNDDYRRQRPTLHRRFDEALAILAGDALLTDAFFLASSSANNALAIVRELAVTAGSRGLVAGQAEDLVSSEKTEFLMWLALNSAKTARLFEAAAAIGGYAACATAAELSALRKFGHSFGVAFQIKDDLDDQSGLAQFADEAKVALHENLWAANNALEQLKSPDFLRSLIHLAFANAV